MRPARAHRAILGLAFAAAAACRGVSGPDSAAGSVSIRTDRDEYRPVESIVVTTTNSTGRVVFDDHCAGEVQGFEYLGRWNASFGAGRACVLLGFAPWRDRSVAIQPGAVHADTFHVNGLAYAGTWRVELHLLTESGALLPEAERVSNTFRVRR